MFMAAGFCMLEAGQVRSKNTAVICLKNIGLFSIAGIMYYFVGEAMKLISFVLRANISVHS